MKAPFVTGKFGSIPVRFRTPQYHDAPRDITFSAKLRLSELELAAALWSFAATGVARDELDDLKYVREAVADMLVNGGLGELEEAVADVSKLLPGTFDHNWFHELRLRVQLAFAAELLPTLGSPERMRATAATDIAEE